MCALNLTSLIIEPEPSRSGVYTALTKNTLNAILVTSAGFLTKCVQIGVHTKMR
jgi:hypothetical protein